MEPRNDIVALSISSELAPESYYIMQFNVILQEVDPCEDLTDDDIRTAIQNATGPKSALFVPEVGLITLLSHAHSDIFLVKPTFLSHQICIFFVPLKNTYLLFPCY